MEANRTRFEEHLAVACPLSLEKFCQKIQLRFGLPDFEFDYENETEWALVEYEGIEYNVSRPFKRGTLQKWDESVPTGCNFGITLSVSEDCPQKFNIEWGSTELVPSFGQALADVLGRKVYHHRTWLGAGRNKIRKQEFLPNPKRA